MPLVNTNPKRTRRLQGLSHLQLASRAGVSPCTSQFAEPGKPLSDSTIQRIAAALDVRMDQLLRIDSGCEQDAFTKLPWSIGNRFRWNLLFE